MNFYCAICREPSGSHLVCEKCRPDLTPHEQRKLTIAWHNIVCDRARDGVTDLYRCFHCEKLFPRNKVAGDHFPDTKAARPDLRFDVEAGVCSDAFCNTSGNSNRKIPKKNICILCRVLLATYGDKCFRCRDKTLPNV